MFDSNRVKLQNEYQAVKNIKKIFLYSNNLLQNI